MPRRRPPGSLYSQATFARRLEYEREKRDLSQARLAAKVREAGVEVPTNFVHMVEKGGRKVVVEELVGLADVLGLDFEDLLRPVEVAIREDVGRLVDEYLAREKEAARAILAKEEARASIIAFAEAHPESADYLAALTEARAEQDPERNALAAQMTNLTAAMLAATADVSGLAQLAGSIDEEWTA